MSYFSGRYFGERYFGARYWGTSARALATTAVGSGDARRFLLARALAERRKRLREPELPVSVTIAEVQELIAEARARARLTFAPYQKPAAEPLRAYLDHIAAKPKASTFAELLAGWKAQQRKPETTPLSARMGGTDYDELAEFQEFAALLAEIEDTL